MSKTKVISKREAVTRVNESPKSCIMRVSDATAAEAKAFAEANGMTGYDAADYLIRFAISRKKSLADHRAKVVKVAKKAAKATKTATKAPKAKAPKAAKAKKAAPEKLANGAATPVADATTA